MIIFYKTILNVIELNMIIMHVDYSFTITCFSIQLKKKISLLLLQETMIVLQGILS